MVLHGFCMVFLRFAMVLRCSRASKLYTVSSEDMVQLVIRHGANPQLMDERGEVLQRPGNQQELSSKAVKKH